ncbi:MAG: iron chaperone [Erysipelotrichaceae bacterium]
MKEFNEFLFTITESENQKKLKEVLKWISDNYPNLDKRIAWKQPMFTDHGTFIIGFSVAKKHFAIAVESAAMQEFEKALEQSGYNCSKMLIKIKWDQEVNYQLLKTLIDFNIDHKKNVSTFWAK